VAERVIQGPHFTAKFDKENDPKQGVTIIEDFGDEVTVPIAFLALILQEYGEFKVTADYSQWRGWYGKGSGTES